MEFVSETASADSINFSEEESLFIGLVCAISSVCIWCIIWKKLCSQDKKEQGNDKYVYAIRCETKTLKQIFLRD